MIIDGEKYACESCVRGHRVSNCQHSDRPLQHINKKGRPVSQCHNCRTQRKSRASHVKCDCGEKTHKCIHLQAHVEGHRDSCCCNHGGRCTCSLKREHPHLEMVLESDIDKGLRLAKTNSPIRSNSSRPRRRALATHSEGMLTFDENGHHKPICKHIKASQKCSPYQLNRINSAHPTSNHRTRSVEKFAYASDIADPPLGDYARVHNRRKSRSEATSPLIKGSASPIDLRGNHLPPLDLSSIECSPYVPSSADFFGYQSDHDQPLFSAGLSVASVDWSHYEGLDFCSRSAGLDFAPSNYSQPSSTMGMSSLTNTASSSGEVSEADDFMPKGALEEYERARSGFNLNGSQASMLAGADLGRRDIEEEFFHLGTTSSGDKYARTTSGIIVDEEVTLMNSLAFPDDTALWIENYSSNTLGLNEPSALWDAQ